MKKLSKTLTALYFAVYLLLATVQTTHADAFSTSKLATGTKNLINDITTWLLVIAPIAGGLCIVYFLIRRSHADEMDERKWTNRIKVALISVVGAVLTSSLINVITGYFE